MTGLDYEVPGGCMRRERLSSEEHELLREVILRRQPALLGVVDALGQVPLTDEGREELRGVLAEELCETGLREDGEPNPRGLALDDLISRLTSF
jgi:hypothetical protein